MSRRHALGVLVVVLAAALPAGLTAQSPAPPPSGIFLIGPDGSTKQLPVTTSMDTEMKGIGKSILTQGFSKPTMSARHSGATAATVISELTPVFFFRFQDNSAPQDPMAFMAAMTSGQTALVGKNPKEYVLARLTVDGDARIAASKGLTIVKLQATQKAPREFEVRVATPLEPGEYAFFMNVGGAPTMIWAFSLQPK